RAQLAGGLRAPNHQLGHDGPLRAGPAEALFDLMEEFVSPGARLGRGLRCKLPGLQLMHGRADIAFSQFQYRLTVALLVAAERGCVHGHGVVLGAGHRFFDENAEDADFVGFEDYRHVAGMITGRKPIYYDFTRRLGDWMTAAQRI